MRTIEEEAEIIYGKRKPNAEEIRKALVQEKKRIGKRFSVAEKERDHDLTGQDEENFNED